MNTETICTFLGWCTLINTGLLLVCSLLIICLRDQVTRIHAKLFGLNEHAVHQSYFSFLANYKLFIIMVNLVPYIALKITIVY